MEQLLKLALEKLRRGRDSLLLEIFIISSLFLISERETLLAISSFVLEESSTYYMVTFSLFHLPKRLRLITLTPKSAAQVAAVLLKQCPV